MPCVAHGALGPPAAAPAAAEPRLQRHQVHAAGPRAGRLPPARRPAAHRRLRHRPRHSAVASSAPSSRNSIGSTRARRVARGLGLGLSIVERIARVLDHQLDARLDGRPRLAFLGRGAARAARLPARATARAADARRRRPARRHDGAVHRQRAEDPRRHGRRCSAAGAARCSRRRISTARSRRRCAQAQTPSGLLVDYHLDDGNGIDGDRRAARARSAPTCRPILITADRIAARARGRARARHPGAQQAAQAGGAARAAGAMARPRSRRRSSAQACREMAERPDDSRRFHWTPMSRLAMTRWAQCSGAACGHWPTSILAAAITAWVRLSTPSFCRIAETCAFTVASETPSS